MIIIGIAVLCGILVVCGAVITVLLINNKKHAKADVPENPDSISELTEQNE